MDRLLGPNYPHSTAVENLEITGTVPERPRLSREMGTENNKEKVRDDCLAEREGFEPPVRLPAQQISSLPP